MLKNGLLPLLLLAVSVGAWGQTSCATPVVKLLRSKQEIPATPGPLVPSLTVRVAPEAGCPAQRYRFRDAEITLVRNGRLVLPILLVNEPYVDLRPFMSYYKSGDYLLVSVAYQNILVVGPDGSLRPYSRPVKDTSGQPDLQTDASKGISFRWPLVKP